MDKDMIRIPSDSLDAPGSPLSGSPLVLTGDPDEAGAPSAALVLVDRAGALPSADPAAFAALVTTRPAAPAPWVSVAPGRLEAQLGECAATAARDPVATSMLARLLRLGEGLAFDAALEMESLAYSALLGGGEFAAWRKGAVAQPDAPTAPDPVRYDREGDAVTLSLASPGNRNAMTAAMRDALCEGLANVLDDPSAPSLLLRGDGRCFSTGGHLPEFGTARDLARAHLIRMERSPARLLHRLGARTEARLHGACIGSGIEIPAAAARRIAAPGTFVQLPELRMGLIPGAGGTVTLARAIGRHRLFWLALGCFRLPAEAALEWGLFHAVEP